MSPQDQPLPPPGGEQNECTTPLTPTDSGQISEHFPEHSPSTTDQLREAELRAAEHHDAWLRAKAEADNVRKRAQVDIANTHKYAVESFASELLPVMDSLEAALTVDVASAENLKRGVELTLKQLAGVFDKANLQQMNPVDQKFDPHRHQAISVLPSDKEPNTVISVLQKGYLLHDRVLRPALVTVSKAKDA